ncbi:hypothetical protein [Pseudovibrio sp. SPO723]|uniref:hypothetical protein n=1 Tax=Nesiotobacter zosterae TaxID=392721 RepID=UPI0029C27559|nr:hypothetical protein [Pseudovibrio sp. SPO723]MDX5591985.1 hypothetical protein [Pseudovibrio sp. SPO723]
MEEASFQTPSGVGLWIFHREVGLACTGDFKTCGLQGFNHFWAGRDAARDHKLADPFLDLFAALRSLLAFGCNLGFTGARRIFRISPAMLFVEHVTKGIHGF